MAHTATLPLPAVGSYADGNPLAIHDQLIEAVSGSPEHTREFAEVAARAVVNQLRVQLPPQIPGCARVNPIQLL